MELSEVGRTPSKIDLVENQPESSMTEKIVLAVVLLFGLIAVVAVILAAVAIGRPAATSSDSSGKSSGQSAAPVTCYGGGSSGSSSSSGKDKVYTIALGHDWGAYEYIDTNGYLAGFGKDIIAAVCEAAGMDCRTVWEPYNNCFFSEAGQHPRGGRGLMDRWYDACDGWYVTVNRQAIFKFSQSFLKPVMSQFVVKKGNSFDENKLAGKKIGFIDGWAYDEKCVYRLYKTLILKDKIVHVNGQKALADKLVNGEIDAAYVGLGDLKTYTDGASATLERVGSQKSCMVRGSAMMSRKDSDFPARWNEGYTKIVSNGQFKKICDQANKDHASQGTVDCLT